MGLSTARIGGICGVVSVVAMIPAYLVGYPDAPRDVNQATEYFATNTTFVTANGLLPLLHVLFFLIFLGTLVGLLYRVDRRQDGLPWVALAGGTVFITLSAAGFVAEILYPATLIRFTSVTPDEDLALLSLTLASWLYHYCQIGAAVLIGSTSLLAWRSRAFPVWTAVLGAVVTGMTLLHTWLPLVAAIAGLTWVVVISAAMVLSSPTRLPSN